jgi:ubiquinone/menaquinone biosynthesis C-methylase UbiE
MREGFIFRTASLFPTGEIVAEEKSHVCPWWLAYTFDNPLRRLVHNPLKIVGPYLAANGTAIDVGCGMGYFTLAMARAVGGGGKVYALDIQQKMLDITLRRAERKNLSGPISPILTSADSLHLEGKADFALIFWAAHEFPDRPGLFRQVRAGLKRDGRLLLAEPRFHVGDDLFRSVTADAVAAGLEPVAPPSIAFSHTALLNRGAD